MNDAPAVIPPFARDWPRDPELTRLLDAFNRGNYAYVREAAPKLAEKASDPAVRDAAKSLRRRIDPDPIAGILLLLAVALLVVLASHYLGHRPDKPPPVNQHVPPVHPTSS